MSDSLRVGLPQIAHGQVKRERNNFDPSGHYSRPDVTQLVLNRKYQGILKIKG